MSQGISDAHEASAQEGDTAVSCHYHSCIATIRVYSVICVHASTEVSIMVPPDV